MSVWNLIEKSDEYQSIDDQSKHRVRRDFFTEQIVSDPDFAKLPEPERDKVYLEFVDQGQQPLEQVPETPITDFVGAQDRLLEDVQAGAEKIDPSAYPAGHGIGMPPPPMPDPLSDISAMPLPMPAPLSDITPAPERPQGLVPQPRQKGPGYFGELNLPGGGVATEYSIGVNLDGKETEIPSLVPTLTEEELALMVNDIIPNKKQIPKTIVNKAIIHAKQKIKEHIMKSKLHWKSNTNKN